MSNLYYKTRHNLPKPKQTIFVALNKLPKNFNPNEWHETENMIRKNGKFITTTKYVRNFRIPENVEIYLNLKKKHPNLFTQKLPSNYYKNKFKNTVKKVKTMSNILRKWKAHTQLEKNLRPPRNNKNKGGALYQEAAKRFKNNKN